MNLAFAILSITIASFGCVGILIFIHLRKERSRRLFSPFTEDMHRLPGHSLRLKIGDLEADLVGHLLQTIFVGGLALYFLLTKHLFAINTILIVIFACAVVVWAGRKTLQTMQKLQNYILGLRGEEYTGQQLNFLMRDNAFVFHDLPYKYGNIDHLVVTPGEVIVVETKARRKPQKEKGSEARKAIVEFDGSTLRFPNFNTSKPVEQAKRHADYIGKAINSKLNVDYPVLPVVALPGWEIERSKQSSYAVWIINPKRAKALRKRVRNSKENQNFKEVTKYIASVANSVPLTKKVTDPTANKHYDFWLKPKPTDNDLWD